ncbi:MAG: glycosyltransferase family 4 protein [Candidatus Hydrogenedentes bacterium]|nr:glycosyltransferase family 4 protein [Candidatus Hydrogenedentota bacterium]
MSAGEDTAPIRVAHVITRLCKGGAQENTFHTVRLSRDSRFESDLLSGMAPANDISLEPGILRADIPIEHLPALLRDPAPLSDLRALFQLYQIFRARRYTIVHTHTSKAGLLGRIAARWAGVPIIIHTPHGNIFHGYFSSPKTRLFVALERWAAGFTDRIIELTPGGIEEHLAQGIGRREQFRVIFSGIDLAPCLDAPRRRAETRRALQIPDNAIVVGAVGRLEPVKGFRYLADAARLLEDSGLPLYFLVAGDGSERAMLEAETHDLKAGWRFLGFREDIPALMAAFDMLVVPSVNEGMGRVVLEAGAVGTPVIASHVGGIPDVLTQDETGLLVKAQDSRALADAIMLLAKDPALRAHLGATARQRIVPRYSLEAMVAEIHALYEELLHERSHHPRR